MDKEFFAFFRATHPLSPPLISSPPSHYETRSTHTFIVYSRSGEQFALQKQLQC